METVIITIILVTDFSDYLLQEEGQRRALNDHHRELRHLLGVKQGLHCSHDLIEPACQTTQGDYSVHLRKDGSVSSKFSSIPALELHNKILF